MPLLFLILLVTCAEAETRLTLEQAVQRAIANSPEVIAERSQFQSAAPAINAAQGAFDPILNLRGEWRQATTPATSILQGVNGRLDERTWTQAIGYRQRLPWQGIQIETALDNARIATSNPFTSLNPYYQLTQRTSLIIPLLRNRRNDEFRTELKIRRRETRTLRFEFESRLLDIVSRVEAAYWNLVAASEAHQAALHVERYASESLASTGRMVKEGELAQADLSGARGQLNRAAENRANAYGTLLEAQAQLKSQIASSTSDPIWQDTITAADTRSPIEPIDRNLTNHPDLEALTLRLESQRDQTALTAESARPLIDLSLNYTRQGLAGTAVPQGSLFPGLSLDAPPQLIGGFTRAGNQVWLNRYPTYQATLNIDLPLRNRTAEGRLAQQRLIETRLAAQRKQAEIQLLTGMEQAQARIEAARLRIASAEAALAASDERLQGEFRLFREGQSNNLNLNTRQNELADSRQLLVNAWRSFNLAAADLRRIGATSLKIFSVRVE